MLHRTLAAIEIENHWGRDVWTLHVNEQQAKDTFQNRIKSVREILGEDALPVFCWNGSTNWRMDVDPHYKSNRKETRKPMCFTLMRDWMHEKAEDFGFKSLREPTLEGDDLLGILATKPGNEGRAIVVSDDKDLKTIPGRLYRLPDEHTKSTPRQVREISVEQADLFHLAQTIGGDPTDGYPGAAGFGVSTAQDLLDKGLKLSPIEHELKRGPRKGQIEIRWERVAADNPWETVMSCYAKAEMTEEDALRNARVARILRWDEYDFKTKEVTLWTPH